MAVFIAMCAYSLSMSISPGPVNLVALTSGLNKGFRRAIPFVSGAAIGFALLLLTVGLGVGMVTTSLPLFLAILSYSGSAFIFFMGLNIAKADPVIKQMNGTSSSFIHGFVLQWIASISGIGAFEIEATHRLFEFVVIYFLICYASIACWALAGHKMNLILSEPKALKIFNLVMGGLLMMVAIYLLVMQLM
jgi:threonine/homoserine/homoserine lactone efflux protein